MESFEPQRKDAEFLQEMHSLDAGFEGISFILGSPGAEALRDCSDMMLNASKNILSGDVDVQGLFKYGVVGGDTRFRQYLAEFLSKEYGEPVDSSDLIVTAGATQGLHLILSLLCYRSSPVFVEDPTYFYGFRMIKDDLQMNLVPVPGNKDGLNTDVLDEMLSSRKPHSSKVSSGSRYWAAMYLVPVFGNPTGRTYSIDCCKKLVQLARKHDILLITEDVYNLLYYTGASHATPRLISFDKKSDPDYGRGHVVSSGTFSKILSPSLRLGWIEGPAHIITSLTHSNVAYSGGCFNHYTSMLITSILKSGVLHPHVKFLRQTYKERLDTLCAVLDEQLPGECFYSKPEGGFFLWLKLRQDVNAFKFVQFAKKKYGVIFLPGDCTSPGGAFQNYARLSISSVNKEKIYEGAVRLCQAYKEFTDALEKP